MPREDAAKLVPRTRLALERLSSGEISRCLINELSQVVLLTDFITEVGHGQLEIAWLENVERSLVTEKANMFKVATIKLYFPSPERRPE